LDIRVPGTNGKKVYLCHAPPGNPGNAQTLEINTNSVNAHLINHPEDRLGQCGQSPCSTQQIFVRGINISEQKSVERPLMVSVLPNPSTSYFTIFIEGKNNLPAIIRITDMYGRVIIQRSGVSANSYHKIGNELIPGVYFVEVRQGEEQKVAKLIKQ
jgi:hypothetical protein